MPDDTQGLLNNIEMKLKNFFIFYDPWLYCPSINQTSLNSDTSQTGDFNNQAITMLIDAIT